MAMLSDGGRKLSGRSERRAFNRARLMREYEEGTLSRPRIAGPGYCGANRKKLAGKLLVTVTATTGSALVNVSQLVEAAFVAYCKI